MLDDLRSTTLNDADDDDISTLDDELEYAQSGGGGFRVLGMSATETMLVLVLVLLNLVAWFVAVMFLTGRMG